MATSSPQNASLLQVSASFAMGVATALLIPSGIYGAFGAMVPDGNITFASIIGACLLLIAIPATIAGTGFFVAAHATRYSPSEPHTPRLGIVSGIVGLLLFLALVRFARNGLHVMLIFAIVFLAAGAAAPVYRQWRNQSR